LFFIFLTNFSIITFQVNSVFSCIGSISNITITAHMLVGANCTVVNSTRSTRGLFGIAAINVANLQHTQVSSSWWDPLERITPLHGINNRQTESIAENLTHVHLASSSSLTSPLWHTGSVRATNIHSS
jgi:hypothetical protein